VVGSETRYRFSLIDESGQIVMETVVNGTKFELPPDTKNQEKPCTLGR